MNDLTKIQNESLMENRNASPDRVIDRLFQRMTLIYGTAWADKWRGVPLGQVKAEWSAGLHSFDTEALRMALAALVKQANPFPPSLPEFRGICAQFVRRGPHRLALVDKSPRDGPPGGFQSLKQVIKQSGIPAIKQQVATGTEE